MKKIMLFICFILFHSIASAEILHLKDGSSLTVKILEKNAKGIKADLNGVEMTYYVDEIQDIDGQAYIPAPAAVMVLPAGIPKSSPVKMEDKKALILKFIEVFGTFSGI